MGKNLICKVEKSSSCDKVIYEHNYCILCRSFPYVLETIVFFNPIEEWLRCLNSPSSLQRKQCSSFNVNKTKISPLLTDIGHRNWFKYACKVTNIVWNWTKSQAFLFCVFRLIVIAGCLSTICGVGGYLLGQFLRRHGVLIHVNCY